MKNNYSDFGKEVKKKLIEIDETQEWLIAEIRKDTGLFVDSSYLNRILTGRNNNPKIVASIKKILSFGGELNLSTKIQSLLQEKGYSLGELSEITGIPKSAIHRYATGETERIPFDRVKIIASALGVSTEYLTSDITSNCSNRITTR